MFEFSVIACNAKGMTSFYAHYRIAYIRIYKQQQFEILKCYNTGILFYTFIWNLREYFFTFLSEIYENPKRRNIRVGIYIINEKFKALLKILGYS